MAKVTLWCGIFLMMLISSKSDAWQQCGQKWACVEVKYIQDGVEFYLVNRKAYTITMTLNIKPKRIKQTYRDSEYQHQSQHKVTHSLKGYERVRVLSYLYTSKQRRSYSDYDFDFNWAVGRLDAKHDDDFLYRLPFSLSKSYPVVQGFNGGYSHQGLSRFAVDFAMPVGTEVHAARGGVVVDIESRHNKGGASRRYGRYANFIVIEHNDGTTGEYYHLKQHGVSVSLGDKVKQGQLIGYSGNTGFTSLPHLHFAVYKALPNGDTQSLPFKFETIDGVVTYPRHGRQYRVTDDE